MKTLTAYAASEWRVELRTVELPEVPPRDEVLIRVTACAVCGSDISMMSRKGGGEPKPFGHEVAGIVERVGEGVTNVREGDTVVLESSSFCGRCELCRDGRVDLCRKAPVYWGRPAMGFSERMLVPSCCAVPYDATRLAPDVACLTEPLGVAMDMVRTADIAVGDSVAVVGPGPIGLGAVAFALRGGACKVVCIGLPGDAKRIAVAKEFGAETMATGSPLGEIAELKGKFDHVLMTAPVGFIPLTLPLLAYGGEMTYIGIGTGDSRITFDGNDFHFRKLQLRASFASPAMYFPAVLRFLHAHAFPAGKLVSHRFPLREIGAAAELLRDRRDETIKVVILPA